MLRGASTIPSWSSEDLNLAQDKLMKMDIVELLSPSNMGRDCEFIDGASLEEKAEKLAAVFTGLR